MIRLIKKPNIQKAIFKTLAGKNAVSFDTIKKEVENNIKSSYDSKNKPEYAIARSIRNLASDGLIECFPSDLQPYFRLSSKGKQKLNNQTLDDSTTLVSNHWDGNWRIILLDLPEDRKNERDSLRYLLKKAGFVCVKNSVWISMYPFEHLFTNIKNDLGLTTELIIIVTDQIDELTKKEFLALASK